MLQTIDIYWPYINFVSREYLDPLPNSFWPMLLIILSLWRWGIFCGVDWLKALSQALGFWVLLTYVFFASGMGAGVYLAGGGYHYFVAALVSTQIVARRGFIQDWLVWLIAVLLFLITNARLGFFGVVVLSGIFLYAKRVGSRNFGLILAAFVSLAAIGLMNIVQYPISEYPPDARLAPISASWQRNVSRFGPYLHPDPLVYTRGAEVGMDVLGRMLIVLTLLILGQVIVWYFAKKNGEDKKLLAEALISSKVFAVSLFVTLVLGWHLWSPLGAVFSPFYFLNRVVPGVALLGGVWVLLPWVFAIGWIGSCAKVSAKGSLFALVVALYFLATISPVEARALAVREVYSDAHANPSGFVVETYGEWVVGPQVGRAIDKMAKVSLSGCSVTASVNPLSSPAIIDGSEKTVWSTKRPQSRGDSLILSCDTLRSFSTLAFSLGKASADFPRGLAISVAQSNGEWQPVFAQEDWQGQIKWTAGGFPYYSSQSEVVVHLKDQQPFRELKVEQIGNDQYYNWSVAELKLFALLPSEQS